MDNLWITYNIRIMWKQRFEKLGSIVLTAIISAFIAWLQAILAEGSSQQIATAEPETAGAIGLVVRGVIESIKRV